MSIASRSLIVRTLRALSSCMLVAVLVVPALPVGATTQYPELISKSSTGQEGDQGIVSYSATISDV